MLCRHCGRHPTREETPRRRRRRDGVHELTVTRRYHGTDLRPAGTSVPFVRMSGHWLERCGFGKGARIFVLAEQGRLTITNFDPAPIAAEQQTPAEAPAKTRRAQPRAHLDHVRTRLRRLALQRSSFARARGTMPLPSSVTTTDAQYP